MTIVSITNSWQDAGAVIVLLGGASKRRRKGADLCEVVQVLQNRLLLQVDPMADPVAQQEGRREVMGPPGFAGMGSQCDGSAVPAPVPTFLYVLLAQGVELGNVPVHCRQASAANNVSPEDIGRR